MSLESFEQMNDYYSAMNDLGFESDEEYAEYLESLKEQEQESYMEERKLQGG